MGGAEVEDKFEFPAGRGRTRTVGGRWRSTKRAISPIEWEKKWPPRRRRAASAGALC